MSANNRIAQQLGRQFLYQAQGGFCPHCGGPMSLFLFAHDLAPSMDHVWARNRGRIKGRDCLGNYLLAHTCCNHRKANNPPTGCELLILFVANRKLGLSERMTAKFDSPWDTAND